MSNGFLILTCFNISSTHSHVGAGVGICFYCPSTTSWLLWREIYPLYI